MKYNLVLIIIFIINTGICNCNVNNELDWSTDDTVELHFSLRIDVNDFMNRDAFNYVFIINDCIEGFYKEEFNINCRSFHKILYKCIQIEEDDLPLIKRIPIDTVSVDLPYSQLIEIFNLTRSLFEIDSSIDIVSQPETCFDNYDGPYATVYLELPKEAITLQTSISFALDTKYQSRLKKLLKYLKEIENNL